MRTAVSASSAVSSNGGWQEGAVAAAWKQVRQLHERAMRGALAGWTEVDLLKLQAGGSPEGDLAEARAVRSVFATLPRNLVSFKGEIGHTLGASGPAELALLLDALARGVVPPTKGFSRPDRELGLEPKGGDGRSVRLVLFNLAGFGGHVTSLALELAALWAGVLLYARQVPAGRPLGDVALYVFAAGLSAIELWAAFGPGPASGLDEAHTALTAYLGLAALAWVVDRVRQVGPARAKFLESQAV